MTQISKIQLKRNTAERIFEIFIKTLLNIQKKSEAEKLISDFFTPTERIMLAKRLAIALLLEKGYNYLTIKDLLHVSTATIAHVNVSRKYGSDGYKLFMAKILKEESVDSALKELLIGITDVVALSRKGSGSWKYIGKKLKESKQDSIL